eukprot:sb/3474385/
MTSCYLQKKTARSSLPVTTKRALDPFSGAIRTTGAIRTGANRTRGESNDVQFFIPRDTGANRTRTSSVSRDINCTSLDLPLVRIAPTLTIPEGDRLLVTPIGVVRIAPVSILLTKIFKLGIYYCKCLSLVKCVSNDLT